MENPMDWCDIESDPGVFTELIKGIGVKNVQVEEIYSLDDNQLIESFSPIYGLIFLFKWTNNEQQRQSLDYEVQDLFFAQQVIKDACATYALLAVLLNNNNIDIGSDLTEFKNFTKELNSELKGYSLSNSDKVRNVHNSFARQAPFEIYRDPNQKTGKKKDVFHFIAIVPHKGNVYVLDGLQKGPILLGSFQGDNWLDLAKKEINERIASYNQSEILFNLMAVIPDLTVKAEQNLLQQNKIKLAHYQQLLLKNQQLDGMQEADLQELKKQFTEEEIKSINIPSDKDIEYYKIKIDDLNAQIMQLNNVIVDEKQKKQKQYKENQRRKHNYIPLTVDLLKLIAQKGKLEGLIEKAKQKKKERQANQEKEKQLKNQNKQEQKQ